MIGFMNNNEKALPTNDRYGKRKRKTVVHFDLCDTLSF